MSQCVSMPSPCRASRRRSRPCLSRLTDAAYNSLSCSPFAKPKTRPCHRSYRTIFQHKPQEFFTQRDGERRAFSSLRHEVPDHTSEFVAGRPQPSGSRASSVLNWTIACNDLRSSSNFACQYSSFFTEYYVGSASSYFVRHLSEHQFLLRQGTVSFDLGS